MFHKMIESARNKWYGSKQCTVNSLIDYIVSQDKMRDAQIEAIKTYLYLKIGCENKPLTNLFKEGSFNSMNLDNIALTSTARAYFEQKPEAVALLEYSRLQNDSGEQVSASLEKQITQSPDSINYDKVFDDIFYGVSYTDYLFSLPMGAGKTYLMASFIYLDLFFAANEPENEVFAHNFIILAPSGLKSSVVPSLRTIQHFDPSWVLPEPAAANIKRKMRLEVLDQAKTANKSNKVKNPNVQKLAGYRPFSQLFGLVVITNAEKVILDRISEQNGQITFYEDSDDDKDRAANELRNLIGKLPKLSVFIDEVHHAVSDDIKLRAVVNKWSENRTINSVIGFSGTPYLEKKEKIVINDSLSIASSEIANIVYYYPLVRGVGNFLKRPAVKISSTSDSGKIVEEGIREFFDTYKDTIYNNELTAKLGIYCGTIEKLEQVIYPIAKQIAGEYGISDDLILRFHKGNKEYPQPVDSQLQYDILDTPVSKMRIVLLVQIGKEGWDCRSLTGIILSQEGDCPRNMVLQTSCRCLRQVEKGMPETALIYLNGGNGEKLTTQLRQQHHISLQEFEQANNFEYEIKRYDRREHLRLPSMNFYQLKIRYDTQITEKANPRKDIPASANGAGITPSSVKTQDFALIVSETFVEYKEHGDVQTTFPQWLHNISKSSFNFITIEQLYEYEELLLEVFNTVTYEKNGLRYFSSKYNQRLVEENIRKAFYDKRMCTSSEELLPADAQLLQIDKFTDVVKTEKPSDFYPEQTVVQNIIDEDAGIHEIPEKDLELIRIAKETGRIELAESINREHASHPAKDRTFHYLPYKTGSGFEETFLREVLTYPELKDMNLEVYYNGDRSLTDFKICCYKEAGNMLKYIGKYTPDFLIINRKDGEIYKAVIIETKGRVYANDPEFTNRRGFMETYFVPKNNEAYGYDRFEYLYLEDSMPEDKRLAKTSETIRSFFTSQRGVS